MLVSSQHYLARKDGFRRCGSAGAVEGKRRDGLDTHPQVLSESRGATAVPAVRDGTPALAASRLSRLTQPWHWSGRRHRAPESGLVDSRQVPHFERVPRDNRQALAVGLESEPAQRRTAGNRCERLTRFAIVNANEVRQNLLPLTEEVARPGPAFFQTGVTAGVGGERHFVKTGATEATNAGLLGRFA